MGDSIEEHSNRLLWTGSRYDQEAVWQHVSEATTHRMSGPLLHKLYLAMKQKRDRQLKALDTARSEVQAVGGKLQELVNALRTGPGWDGTIPTEAGCRIRVDLRLKIDFIYERVQEQGTLFNPKAMETCMAVWQAGASQLASAEAEVLDRGWRETYEALGEVIEACVGCAKAAWRLQQQAEGEVEEEARSEQQLLFALCEERVPGQGLDPWGQEVEAEGEESGVAEGGGEGAGGSRRRRSGWWRWDEGRANRHLAGRLLPAAHVSREVATCQLCVAASDFVVGHSYGNVTPVRCN